MRPRLTAILLVSATACGSVRDPAADAPVVPTADAPIPPVTDAPVAPPADAAPPPDTAPPDAFVPTTPPVSDNQPADLVLGQASFTTELPSLGAGSFNTPVGLASDGTSLWIGDGENDRILQWNDLPIASGAQASLALGQGGTTSHDTAGPTQTTMGRANLTNTSWLFHDGIHLIATDAVNHRVLVWNGTPGGSGEPAALVLGQTSFTTYTSGSDAAHFEQPRGIWSDGTRLVIADGLNHRVLVWTTFPTTSGQPADLVLGQPAFGVDLAPSPPTASSMNLPTGVFVHADRLYVADTGNNRVLVWASFPTTNGAPADLVIGQGGFASSNVNAGGSISAVGLYGPQGLAVAHGSLFVADTQNDRVLVYTPAPTTSGAAASAVLGRADFTTGGPTDPTATSLGRPRAVLVVETDLWVTQSDFHRATRFALTP